jgi:hypothetical protein
VKASIRADGRRGGGDLVRRRATAWRGSGDLVGRARRFGGESSARPRTAAANGEVAVCWRRRSPGAMAEATSRCEGGGEVAARSMSSPTEEGGCPRSNAQKRSLRAWGVRGGRTDDRQNDIPSFLVSSFFLGVEISISIEIEIEILHTRRAKGGSL